MNELQELREKELKWQEELTKYDSMDNAIFVYQTDINELKIQNENSNLEKEELYMRLEDYENKMSIAAGDLERLSNELEELLNENDKLKADLGDSEKNEK